MNNNFLTKSDKAGMIRQLLNSPGKRFVSMFDSTLCLETFEELQKRDEQRKKDGFKKKIAYKIIPDSGGLKIPVTTEHKLVHGDVDPSEDDDGEAGQAEGEEGDVIGQKEISDDDYDDGEGDEPQPGDGEGGDHGIESEEAYKIGKKLTKEFKLPNLKEKGKKFPVNEYTYDLTSRNIGSGQLLDKKATLRKIVETNIGLGTLDKENIDTDGCVVGPKDRVFRTLDREKVWKSKAVVFFLKDYSGSMDGEPTVAVVNQHQMIYFWLMGQYEKRVIPRFILHDTRAKEVGDFGTYLRSKVAGGTKIFSGYELINDIVEREGLERDYNIFVFQGTDGDDFDSDGSKAIPELEKILTYVNRIGMFVIHGSWFLNYGAKKGKKATTFENYIKASGLLGNPLLRMTTMNEKFATNEKALVKSIRALIS